MKCIKMQVKKGSSIPTLMIHRVAVAIKRAGMALGPPILGIIGRESGQIQLEVKHNSTRKDLEPTVLGATQPGATINTDEWGSLQSPRES